MATQLINNYKTTLKANSDSLIAEAFWRTRPEGLIFGSANRRSRLIKNSTTKRLNTISNSLTEPGSDTGSMVYLLNTDKVLNADTRIFPCVDFVNGVLKNNEITGYAAHLITEPESDAKMGIVDMPKSAAAWDGKSSTIRKKWGYTKANGTINKVVEAIDVLEDITSGECTFFEYALDTTYSASDYLQNNFIPSTVYGFGPNSDIGFLNNKVIMSNDSLHCTHSFDITTGEITTFAVDSVEYNLVPGNFTNTIVIGDYFYYIGCDGYIRKVNKTTLEIVTKGSNSISDYSVDNLVKSNLFYDGTNLYYEADIANARYGASLAQINLDTLNTSSGTQLYQKYTLPSWFLDSNNRALYISIYNVGSGYYALYNYNKSFVLIFTDLSNISGSIVPEMCQFNVYVNAITIVNNKVWTLWTGQNANDFGTSFKQTLKICPGTSYQVFSVGEISGGYTKTENDVLTLELKVTNN